MAVDVEHLLVATGAIVVGAFLANLAFRIFRLPDIIFLIAFGVTLGPWLHLIEVPFFQAVAPFIGTVALIIILFEGGLKINRQDLARGVGSGALLAFLVFAATALLSALVGVTVADLEAEHALLLGMSLGGAGAVIVIPLIQQLGVGTRAQTIVSIEAAVSDVLVVLGVVGLSTALVLQRTDPGDFFQLLAQNFSVGILLGVAVGLAWARGLRAFVERSYEYVLTVAILFLLYAGTEFLHGSGPLAVLTFGLILGNSRKTRKLAQELGEDVPRKKGRTWEWTPVFGGELANLHHEVVFFVRAFFFVTLGVLVDLSLFQSPRFLGIGFLLALAVVLARYWGSTLLFRKSDLPAWDRRAIGLMFPLGLAAAVVSLIPSQRFGIPGTDEFGSYAVVAIVLTNLTSALLVFFTARHASPHKTSHAAGH